jgi:hypothetical protein
LTRRCTAESLGRKEPQFGTASVVRAFLLVEFPGAWGSSALRHARLPDGIGAWLSRESARHGIKTLLIRRHGRRAAPEHPRVFAAFAHPERPWMETGALGSMRDVLDLDLAALREGTTVGLTRTEEPIFCVCTHGRHDVCCAELGRPVAAALAGHYPAAGWEVSHIGGDRFAANVLVLPHGLYYGRVGPERVDELVDQHLAGHLTLDLWRGRSAYPFVVQAGEYYLRRELQESRLDALRLSRRVRRESEPGADATWELDFAGGSGIWTVRLRSSMASPALLTCQAPSPSAAPSFTLLGIDAPSGNPASPRGHTTR